MATTEIEVYIGTASQRYKGSPLTAWAILFPARPELSCKRRVRNTRHDETHFGQLCALLQALHEVKKLKTSGEPIQRVVVKTNARRFVTSIQMEISRQSSLGYIGIPQHKAVVMDRIVVAKREFQLDAYFAPNSDAYVEHVGDLAKSVFT